MHNGSHGSDQRIKVENVEIQLKDGYDLAELNSNGWTNEKHMLYLTSMEASFVDQLYNNNNNCTEYNSSATPKLSLTSTNNQCQFKVLSEGNWKIRGYARNANKYEMRTENGNSNESEIQTESGSSNNLLSSPWIQRLRSHNHRNNAHGHEIQPEIHDCKSEVSDQNFIDQEIEGVADSARPMKRPRSRMPR
ncbi:hypothetical protein LUZ60_005677 [Juncus effusus]|nr:hypothetical protein LUZ60_005677 [Juncus effusus]